MTFEEFEKATDEDLRGMAKERFEGAQRPGHTGERVAAWFLEAQFYMSELDRREAVAERRESSRIAVRDYRMEWVVIILILLELVAAIWGIALSAKESREQAQTTERMIKTLDNVEKAAKQAAQLQLLRR